METVKHETTFRDANIQVYEVKRAGHGLTMLPLTFTTGHDVANLPINLDIERAQSDFSCRAFD